MKCTARDIVDLSNALRQHGGLNLLPKIVLPFSRLQRAVKTEAETIGEAQEKITQDHLLRDAEGNPVKTARADGQEDFKIADPKAYQAALKDLLAAEVDIPGNQFDAADLIRGEINSDIVAALHWALKPEAPPAPAA